MLTGPVPTDNQLVWVRRLPFYDTPEQYYWQNATRIFSKTTGGGGRTMPWYVVHSWKP